MNLSKLKKEITYYLLDIPCVMYASFILHGNIFKKKRFDMTAIETLLNAEQVAEMLGLSVATIRKWVLLRYIPFQKLGSSVRFSVSEIKEWQKSRTIMPTDTRKNDNGGNI
jgi:excisionase family DNA binding protein